MFAFIGFSLVILLLSDFFSLEYNVHDVYNNYLVDFLVFILPCSHVS